MDPDENLRKQLKIAKLLLDETLPNSVSYRFMAEELAELVQALDKWLSARGFLPMAWSLSRRTVPAHESVRECETCVGDGIRVILEDAGAYVERCGECEKYDDDEAAAKAFAERVGLTVVEFPAPENPEAVQYYIKGLNR